jgi:glycerol-3-phosphate dehydrogenase
MTDQAYDLVIAGGGINGTGIAADAAARGLTVLLAEMGDLAGATSSASSKLVHGGLRYLEHFEFRLVRESLEEREVLLAKAPHIVRPLRFVLPHVQGMRPRPLILAGLVLYDHLGARRRIPASSLLDLRRDPAGRPLRPDLSHGFAYWDCWVDDARLVVLNARAAARRGAAILTRTRVSAVTPAGALWRVTLASGAGTREVGARALVNAAGPWVAKVAALAHGPAAGGAPLPPLRLVKGSHIVVPRIPGAEDAYLLQSADGRVVFALPFEERFTLIGTTDVPFSGDPGDARPGADEEDYLITLAAKFFSAPLSRDDIVWRFAGVRPLLDDGSATPAAVSRDYRLDLAAGTAPPLLNVIGGKITTYRRLAEAALEKLAPHFPGMGRGSTATVPLPGGAVGEAGIEGFALDLACRRPGFPDADLGRLVRLYGTEADALLGDAKEPTDLGADLGGGLTEREVRYLKENEWAREPDDVLWRRTKAGLHMDADDRPRAADRIAQILGA